MSSAATAHAKKAILRLVETIGLRALRRGIEAFGSLAVFVLALALEVFPFCFRQVRLKSG